MATSTKGYLLSGRSNHTGGVFYNDLWEYDPINDSWTQKANIPNSARTGAIGFSFDSLVFFGLGNSGNSSLNDFYLYNQDSNLWVSKAIFPGIATRNTMYGVCQQTGYVFGGITNSLSYSNEFWKYNPDTDSWSQIQSSPLGRRNAGVSFTIDSLIYFGLGHYGNSNYKDFWSYNPKTNSWVQLPDLPGIGRKSAFAFIVNGKAIVGGGQIHGNGTILNDYYSFDPNTNSWTALAGFSDGRRSWSGSFTISNKGYITGGRDLNNGSVRNTWSFEYLPTQLDFVESINSKVLVYPNPAKENISFKYNEFFIGGELKIFDQSGKLIMQHSINSSNLNIRFNTLENGVYYYWISKGGNQNKGKFIKMK